VWNVFAVNCLPLLLLRPARSLAATTQVWFHSAQQDGTTCAVPSLMKRLRERANRALGVLQNDSVGGPKEVAAVPCFHPIEKWTEEDRAKIDYAGDVF
jgi:hypothetical protein